MSRAENALYAWITAALAGQTDWTLVLVGKKCSGKTALATAIAKRMNKSLMLVQDGIDFESYIYSRSGYSDSPLLTADVLGGLWGTSVLVVVQMSDIPFENCLPTDDALEAWDKIIARVMKGGS